MPGKQLSFRGAEPDRLKRGKRATRRHAWIYEEQNRQAAEIILRERERYAGLPVMWAERWLAGHAAYHPR
jgi:hypothetical protein